MDVKTVYLLFYPIKILQVPFHPSHRSGYHQGQALGNILSGATV